MNKSELHFDNLACLIDPEVLEFGVYYNLGELKLDHSKTIVSPTSKFRGGKRTKENKNES